MAELAEFRALCLALHHPDDGADREVWPAQNHNPEGIRALFAHGLSVCETLTPDLFKSLERTADRLGLSKPPLCIIENNPEPNACAFWGVGDSLGISLTSGLIRLLSVPELDFVIGHELGHHGLGFSHASPEPPSETVQRARQVRARAHEFSADRIGMVACGSLVVAASALIKQTCGLSAAHVRFDVRAYITKVRAAFSRGELHRDLDDTHPLIPTRVLALLLFADSEPYLRQTESAGIGRPKNVIDQELSQLIITLGGRADVAMRAQQLERALAWSIVLDGGSAPRDSPSSLTRLIKKAKRYRVDFGAAAAADKLNETTEAVLDLGINLSRDQMRAIETYLTDRDDSTRTSMGWKYLNPSLQKMLRRAEE